jgi:hypothetical protein
VIENRRKEGLIIQSGNYFLDPVIDHRRKHEPGYFFILLNVLSQRRFPL